MGWIDGWYPDAIASLGELRGQAGLDPGTGYRLPAISALDTLGVLGTVARPLADAITRIMADNGARGALAMRVGLDEDDDGLISGAEMLNDLGAAGDTISIADYLAASGVEDEPSKRSTDDAGLIRYSLYFEDTLLGGEEFAYLGQIRDAVAKWQHAIDASVDAIRAHGANLAAPMTTREIAAFFTPIRALCIALDVLRENPPQDRKDRIKSALGGALNETSRWAGETAADLAGKAGEIAGNFGEGFLSNASVMTLAVAGVAVWLGMR